MKHACKSLNFSQEIFGNILVERSNAHLLDYVELQRVQVVLDRSGI